MPFTWKVKCCIQKRLLTSSDSEEMFHMMIRNIPAGSYQPGRTNAAPTATACQLPFNLYMLRTVSLSVLSQGQTWFILRLFLLLQEYCKYVLINVTCRILIESRFPLHFLSFTARVKVRLMLHRRSCSALQEILTSTISFNLNYSRDEKLDGGSGTETHRHCSMNVPTHSISCLNCSQPLYNPGPSSSEASWGKMWTYRFL